ncbi:MAG TPA: hypothetical protein VMR41_02235 [Patescibacteria group bacterium]|nr:hypothetical protein [Patescibacteria group bacterium]
MEIKEIRVQPKPCEISADAYLSSLKDIDRAHVNKLTASLIKELEKQSLHGALLAVGSSIKINGNSREPHDIDIAWMIDEPTIQEDRSINHIQMTQKLYKNKQDIISAVNANFPTEEQFHIEGKEPIEDYYIAGVAGMTGDFLLTAPNGGLTLDIINTAAYGSIEKTIQQIRQHQRPFAILATT